jgi:hypothetical protein
MNGLVLCLDAANTKSYPGSGTSWTDLSGNSNTGTLTNGPTYSSANGGSIVFDGTNDYISLTSTIIADTPSSFFAWVYRNDSTTVDVIFGENGRYSGLLLTTDGRLHFLSQTGGSFQIESVSSIISNTSWYYVGVTRGSTDKLYLNGQQVASGTNTQARNVNINYIGQTNTTSDYFNGRISNATVYNRALSADEVSQNYNATRGRYGL